MEDSVKTGVIVDFFGLPGSGKTTIAHLLASELQHRGLKTVEPIYEINSSTTIKRLFVKIWAATCFSLGHFQFMRRVFAQLGPGSFQNLNEAISLWVNICLVLKIMTDQNGGYFLVADQGLMQAVVSLSVHSKSKNLQSVIQSLISFVDKPVKFIYFSTDIETVLNRLEARSKNRSRIEREKNVETRIKHLENMKKVCMEIAELFDCLVVDNNADKIVEKDAAVLVVNKILEYLGVTS